MKLYIVIMYKKGNREKHGYLLGAFSTAEIAETEGQKEKLYMNKKYKPVILVTDSDSSLTNNEIGRSKSVI